MAYKVGTTIVIDDSGNVDWSRITNKPAAGIDAVAVSNGSPSSGVGFRDPTFWSSSFNRPFLSTGSIGEGNCNCVQNCYVESLSGGGSSGSVTITANRRTFNCNCNCNCRC